MNEAKLSAAQRAYDNRMPDEEGDMLDAWVDHIMANRDELTDVLEEHYTRPIAEFLAYKLTAGLQQLPPREIGRLVHAARIEVEALIYAHCRKEVNEPTGAQIDAYDDREAGR